MAERDDDPDAPPSAEEIAASQRLRDALEKGDTADPDVALVASLRAAWSPDAIEAAEHRAIVDATPTADELVSAAALRDALTKPASVVSGDALLAVALRNAWAPTEISLADHDAIIERALRAMPAARDGNVVDLASRRRATVVRVTFGVVTGALALAASIVLVLGWQGSRGDTGGVALARVRTTQPLFSEPFKPGETSARIDRIASARASDFRDNRFAKWGVR